MKFYNEDDLTDERFEIFCQEIEEISKRADEKAILMTESQSPEFKTIEEARAYYGSMSFSEWENNMRERLGLQ